MIVLQLYKKLLNSISNRLPLSLSVKHSDGSIQNVGVGGPKVEIHFHNYGIYHHLLLNPSLAFGEGYANKDITVPSDNLFQLFQGYLSLAAKPGSIKNLKFIRTFIEKFSSGNTLGKARLNVQAHYDKFHRIVSLVVDPETNLYSCAFFDGSDTTLNDAQIAKTKRTLAKLDLKQNQNALEIGCGYGYIAREAARFYGVNVTALTLSNEQHRVANEKAKSEGLNVKTLKMDYREISGQFDAAYSVAMYEAVGHKHWDEFFLTIQKNLKKGGLFLLHTVTQKLWEPMDSFIDKHVFPGSELPTPRQVLSSAESAGLRFHHAESWKPHYSKTLLYWYKNLRLKKNQIFNLYANEAEAEWYYRLWEIYLAGCAAAFTAEEGMDLHQFIFSKGRTDWDITQLKL